MNREELRKLGLNEEQVSRIMDLNGDDINAQKAIVVQRDETIKALTTERDGLKAQVSDRDKDIANLRKTAGDNSDLSKRLTDLQTKYDTDTKNLQQTIDKQARSHAMEGLFGKIEFTSAFARKAAMNEFEAANLEFKDGSFVGADETIKKMREANPDAFKAKEEPPKEPPKPNLPYFTPPTPKDDKGGSGSTNPFNFSFNHVRADNSQK